MALTFTSPVTLDKSLIFPMLQLPYLGIRDDSDSFYYLGL